MKQHSAVRMGAKTVFRQNQVEDFPTLRPQLGKAAEAIGHAPSNSSENHAAYAPDPSPGKLCYPIIAQWINGILDLQGPNAYGAALLIIVFLVPFFLGGCGMSDEQMQNTIHSAAAKGDIQLVEKILNKDPCYATVPKGENGRTPLHVAASAQIAQSLINHGADVNALDKFKWTPLHSAVKGEVAELLIKNGSDIKARNDRKRLPIHTASCGEVALALIKSGQDINETIADALHKPGAYRSKQADFLTPLYCSIIDNRFDVAKSLIQSGADISRTADNGETYLHLAAKTGKKEIVEALLGHGAKVDSLDKFEATPLHHAVLQNRLETARALLEKGANVNARLSPHATLHTSDFSTWSSSTKDIGQATPIKMTTSEEMKNLLRSFGAIE